MLGARVCAHTTSFTSSQSSYSSRSSSRFPLFLPDVLPSLLLWWLPQAGSRAGPGPQRSGLIGDHALGGSLRGRPPKRLARALPRPGLHAPIPNPPSAGTGTGGRDSGRPRTDRTGCVVWGRRFVGVMVRCVCYQYSVDAFWVAPVAVVVRVMPRRKGSVLDAENVR